MNIPEYAPPAGYYDRPYTYVFYLDDLPGVGSVVNLQTGVPKRIALKEDFFVLRQIKFANMLVGNNSLSGATTDYATGFRFRDALGRDTASGLRAVCGGYQLSTAITANPNKGNNIIFGSAWPIVPEIVYPRNSSIVFDIAGFTTAYNGSANSGYTAPYYHIGSGLNDSYALSQLHFVGAKRLRGVDPVVRDTQGRTPEDYTYAVKVTVSTPASGNSVVDVKQYFQFVAGWHFELTDVSVVNDICTTQSAGLGGSVRIKLFDSQKIPCADTWLSCQAFNQLQQSTPATSQTATPQGMGALCPSLWYPDQTSIPFEIQNILTAFGGANNVSQTVTILFHGKKWQKKG